MIFRETELEGALLIELERHVDERGFFARSFCQREFLERGLHGDFPQANVSFSQRKGTLRGLHHQLPPHAEVKLVRCTAGAIFVVIVDLRPTSHSYLGWMGVKLNAENRNILYVPEGFAQGFQTLADNSEVFYQMGNFYFPDVIAGIRWNDPRFNIVWPLQPSIISEGDSSRPDFDDSDL